MVLLVMDIIAVINIMVLNLSFSTLLRPQSIMNIAFEEIFWLEKSSQYEWFAYDQPFSGFWVHLI